MIGWLRWSVLGLALAPPATSMSQPYSPPPSDFTAYWEEAAFKDVPIRGPQKALGLILWSHGVDGKNPQWQSPPPEVIKTFARAGWDVVKIQRNSLHEAGWTISGRKHVAYLAERIGKARVEGYANIIAAGQSYGGAISLEVSAQTDQLFGILAFAPGHGSDACGRNGGFGSWRISDNLQQQLVDAIVAVKAPRVVVTVADGDECQGANDPSRLIQAAFGRGAGSFVHLDSSMPIRGHLAAYTPQFRRWYGPCLIDFFDPKKTPPAGETHCPAPSPPQSFLFPEGYRPEDMIHIVVGKIGGPWSGTFAANGGAFSQEVCVVVDKGSDAQIEAVTSFGPGPEKRFSMTTVRRKFNREGASFIYSGSQDYRMILGAEPKAEILPLTIISANGQLTFSGNLKHGC